MRKSPTLDADGNPVWLFGGDDAWQQFEHRGFTVSVEWVFAPSGKRIPPVLAIWSSSGLQASTSTKNGTWVISRKDMHNFFEDRQAGTDDMGNARVAITGKPSRHAIAEARAALPLLGKDPNDKAAHNALVDCVMKFGDLVARIPVLPIARARAAAAAPIWEVTAKDKSTGKVLKEAEV